MTQGLLFNTSQIEFVSVLNDLGDGPTLEDFIKVSQEKAKPEKQKSNTLFRINISGIPWDEFDEPAEIKSLRLKQGINMVPVSNDFEKHQERADWLRKYLPDEIIEVEKYI